MLFLSWLATIIYAGFIFYLSSRTWTGIPLFPFADKIIHFFIYAILGGLLCNSLLKSGLQKRRHLLIYATAIAAFYGATDEFHQYFVPGRSCEFADFVADTIGAFAGVLLVRYLLDFFRRRHAAKI